MQKQRYSRNGSEAFPLPQQQAEDDQADDVGERVERILTMRIVSPQEGVRR
jgi:hypothetical protein